MKFGLIVLMTDATNLRLCLALTVNRSGRCFIISWSSLISSSRLFSLNSLNLGIFRGRMSFKLIAIFLPAMI